MPNRYPRSPSASSSRGYYQDEYDARQQEQFEPDSRYYQESAGSADYGRDHASSRFPESSRSPNYGQSQASRRYAPLDEYDQASADMQSRGLKQPGVHGSFRGDSYGGEAMAGPAASLGSRPYYGMDAGTGSYTGAGEYRDRGPNPNNDRGIIERAGDEIASWFGDEDAERRREMDHRGRGPSNYKRSDERILEDACDRLTDDRGVDASDIEVSVDTSEITLNGKVNSRWEKRRAEDCVHDVSGVGHVQNNLRIRQTEMRAGSAPNSIES